MPRPFQSTALIARTATRPESLRALAPLSLALGGIGMGSGNRLQGGIALGGLDHDGGGGWKAV